MKAVTLRKHLSRKGADLGAVVRAVARSPARLDDVLQGLGADDATVRFQCAKTLLAAAQEEPGAMTRAIPTLLELLSSDNRILRAAAIRTLAYLASVDRRGRITRALPRILEPIPGPDLVVAANAIEGAARIAQAKPHLADRVVPALLSVERGSYRTRECREIALGKVVDALEMFSAPPRLQAEVHRFVRRRLRSRRAPTRRRAERFIRQHSPPAKDPRSAKDRSRRPT